jgi:hypothetical protein
VGLDECIGIVEIVGGRRVTPMLVSNEVNLTLIGVAPCFTATFLK